MLIVHSRAINNLKLGKSEESLIHSSSHNTQQVQTVSSLFPGPAMGFVNRMMYCQIFQLRGYGPEKSGN